MSAALLALLMLAPAAPAVPAPADPEPNMEIVRSYVSPTLATFGSDAAYRRYVGALGPANDARVERLEREAAASAAALPPPPPPRPRRHRASDDNQEILLVESPPPPFNASVNSNPVPGVEAGDRIKRIGRYLIVLVDGQLFVVDPGANQGQGLVLVDRVDAVRDPQADTDYVEALVAGRRLVVAAYSYDQGASEISIFRLEDSGRLVREASFAVTSIGHASAHAYELRLVGDALVLYENGYVGAPVTIRRLRPGESLAQGLRRGRPLFAGGQVYRPIHSMIFPTLHTLAVCPLGPLAGDGEPDCRATAFLADDIAAFYVTDSDAFLWIDEDDSERSQCRPARPFALAVSNPTLLYRIPIAGGPPSLLVTRGLPPDADSVESSGGRFRAFLEWQSPRCFSMNRAPAQLAYMDVPLDLFSAAAADVPRAYYTPLPPTGSPWTSGRFGERHLVYAGLSRGPGGAPLPGRRGALPRAFAVPLAHPGAVANLPVRHSVVRIEQAGGGVLIAGYRRARALDLSYVGFAPRPRIASTLTLPGRSQMLGGYAATGAIIGLPTVGGAPGDQIPGGAAPGLSFLAVDSRGRMTRAGEIEARGAYASEDGYRDHPVGYRCAASCDAWYQLTRPFFAGDRIFALTGAELIEGRIEQGRIVEVQRLDIALAPPPARQP